MFVSSWRVLISQFLFTEKCSFPVTTNLLYRMCHLIYEVHQSSVTADTAINLLKLIYSCSCISKDVHCYNLLQFSFLFAALLGSNLLLSVGMLGVAQCLFKATNTCLMVWGQDLFPPHISLTITASFMDRLALGGLLSTNLVSVLHVELWYTIVMHCIRSKATQYSFNKRIDFAW